MIIEDIKKYTDVPVVVVDNQGIFTYVNDKFCSVFGWQQHNILGQSLTLIIPPNLHDAHNMGFSRFLSTEKPTLLGKPLKLKAVDSSGKEFIAEHFIVAEKINGHWYFAATIKPL